MLHYQSDTQKNKINLEAINDEEGHYTILHKHNNNYVSYTCVSASQA